jgi:NAD(P)-dependent dehydrogenase (short-subunit alcohol dehydrogenase family)
VNTNGVLFTAQAAGQQMLRFGNTGSIILIASMSGSITNKVSDVTVISRSEMAVLMKLCYRTMHGYPITPANQQFSRWLGAWLASLGQRVFESTLYLQGISIQSPCLSWNAMEYC